MISNASIRAGDAELRKRWRERFAALPADSRAALVSALSELRAEARQRADVSWRRHKGPMALYWKVIAVYAGHLVRTIRVRKL